MPVPGSELKIGGFLSPHGGSWQWAFRQSLAMAAVGATSTGADGHFYLPMLKLLRTLLKLLRTLLKEDTRLARLDLAVWNLRLDQQERSSKLIMCIEFTM